jgi:hypothetical protein
MRVEGDGVLPGVLKGSFVTLLSPPQCHAAFGTMPPTRVLNLVFANTTVLF